VNRLFTRRVTANVRTKAVCISYQLWRCRICGEHLPHAVWNRCLDGFVLQLLHMHRLVGLTRPSHVTLLLTKSIQTHVAWLVQRSLFHYRPTLLRYVRFMSSQIRPFVVCNLRAAHSDGWTFCTIQLILGRNSKRILVIVQVKFRGYEKLAVCTNISLNLGNDTIYGHSYHERWIETRMRSVEWCHCQWPWTTHNTE